MRTTLLAGLCLMVAGALAGCKSSDDSAIGQQKSAFETLAASLGAVQDLDGMKKAMDAYSKNRAALINKIRSMPKEQVRAFVDRMESETQLGQDKVDEALKETHERLLKGKSHPQVLMETSMGPVKIELYETLAPVTVKNFLGYVDDKFYDGTIFHRVIPDFMVQGGGFRPNMREKTSGKPIVNESFNGLTNDTGTVAMARTNLPDSATAQFFVNVKNNHFLNRLVAPDGVGYAVFGKVIDGMDVIDKIRQVETDTVGQHENVPVKTVTIQSIRRIEKK